MEYLYVGDCYFGIDIVIKLYFVFIFIRWILICFLVLVEDVLGCL